MKIVISGAPGQDAYYLAELLSQDGRDEIVVTARYSSTGFEQRFKGWDVLDRDNVRLEYLDITDASSVRQFIQREVPSRVYNLAAASHVGQSFKEPYVASAVNYGGVLNWLEAIRQLAPEARFYQASTSELWGSNYSVEGDERFQDESTPFSPNSPYAVAKLAAHNLVRIYRGYGLFCCAGILHNHESERRGERFVTRKITRYVGHLARWIERYGHPQRFSRDHFFSVGGYECAKLQLGNVDAVRDWSHAADMVRGMQLIMEAPEPDDFVLCSGEGHSVRDFLAAAFAEIGVSNYEDYWCVNPEFYRPCEVEYLQGRYTKAKEQLGWSPKISFNELVSIMVKSDL